MKNKILFLIGVLFGLIPIYLVLGWIIIFNQNIELSHADKQLIFTDSILFGINALNSVKVNLIAVLLGLISIVCFALLLNRSRAIENKRKKKISLVSYLFLITVVITFTLLKIWSMM